MCACVYLLVYLYLGEYLCVLMCTCVYSHVLVYLVCTSVYLVHVCI